MKRGGPLKRTKGLSQGDKPLSRGAGLKRSAAPKRKPSKPVRERAAGVIDRIASEAWAKAARSKPCAVCKRRGGGNLIRGHHVIYQQELKRLVGEANFEGKRWDRRNLLPLCDGCHDRHHGATRRVTREVLRRAAPKVFQFAHELDRDFAPSGASPAALFLERNYPEQGASFGPSKDEAVCKKGHQAHDEGSRSWQ